MSGSTHTSGEGEGDKNRRGSALSRNPPTSIPCRTENGVRTPEVQSASLRRPLAPQYNRDDPVGSLCFLLRMTQNFAEKENYLEAMKSAESALLLRKKHADAIQEALQTNQALREFHIPESITDQANSIVSLCNTYAVCAFSAKKFDAAAYLLNKALFLTDSAVEKVPGDLPYSINKVKAMDSISSMERERLPQEGEIATLCFVNDNGARLRQRAATFNNLGCMERRRRQLQQALDYFKHAAQIEVRLDPNGLGSPSTYLNICTLLNEMQRYSEAVPAAERAIAALQMQIQEQTNIPDVCNTAMMLSVGQYNLGVSLEKRGKSGDDKAAAKTFELSLDTARRYLVGMECPTVKAAMNALKHIRRIPQEEMNYVSNGISPLRTPHVPSPSSERPSPSAPSAEAGGVSTVPSFIPVPSVPLSTLAPGTSTHTQDVGHAAHPTSLQVSAASSPTAMPVGSASLSPSLASSFALAQTVDGGAKGTPSLTGILPTTSTEKGFVISSSEDKEKKVTSTSLKKGSSLVIPEHGGERDPYTGAAPSSFPEVYAKNEPEALPQGGWWREQEKASSTQAVPSVTVPGPAHDVPVPVRSTNPPFLPESAHPMEANRNDGRRHEIDATLGLREQKRISHSFPQPHFATSPHVDPQGSGQSGAGGMVPTPPLRRVSKSQSASLLSGSTGQPRVDPQESGQSGAGSMVPTAPLRRVSKSQSASLLSGSTGQPRVDPQESGQSGAGGMVPIIPIRKVTKSQNTPLAPVLPVPSVAYNNISVFNMSGSNTGSPFPPKERRSSLLLSARQLGSSHSCSSPMHRSNKNVFLQPPTRSGSGATIPSTPILEPIRKNSWGVPVVHSGVSLRDMPHLRSSKDLREGAVLPPAASGFHFNASGTLGEGVMTRKSTETLQSNGREKGLDSTHTTNGKLKTTNPTGKLSVTAAGIENSVMEEVGALRQSLSFSVARSLAQSNSDIKKVEKNSTVSASTDMHALFGRRKFSVKKGSNRSARVSMSSSKSKPIDDMQEEVLHRNQLHEKVKMDARRRKAREVREGDEEFAAQMCEVMVAGIREDQVRRCNGAAVSIQRFWRGYLARLYITNMINAVRKLQPAVRIFLIKARAERQRREEEERRRKEEQDRKELAACRFLQARVRQFIRRLQIRREFIARQRRNFYAARRIQRAYRRFCKRREEALAALAEAHRREDEQQRFWCKIAATHIQRAYRQYKMVQKGREAAERCERQDQAATTIQAMVRGVLTRAWFRYYRAYRRDRELRTAESIQRLTIIQAMSRALISHRYVLVRHAHMVKKLSDRRQFLAAAKIQGLWRGNEARIHFQRLRAENDRRYRMATRLQRWYRTRVVRRRFLQWQEEKRREMAAREIQRWIRERWQRRKEKEFAAYHAALLKKQRLVRLQQDSILSLQANLRARSSLAVVVEKQKEYDRKEAVGKIWQRIGRGYLGRKEVGIEKAILKKLERAEMEFALHTASARVIQRAWRCAMARDKVEQLRREQYATLVIARSYRIYKAKKELAELKETKESKRRDAAASLIQRHVREYLRSIKYSQMVTYYKEQERKKRWRMRRAEAAVMIQSLWRGYRTRTAVAHELGLLRERAQYAIVIQRAWRHQKGKVKVAKQVERRIIVCQAARTIQCFWRKMMAAERVARMREQRQQQISCAIRIQAWWRMILAKRVLKSLQWEMEQRDRLAALVSMKWEKATTIINSFLRTRQDQLQLLKRKRGYILTQLTDKERERFIRCRDAATKIQAVYRGHYWRFMIRVLRREKLEEEKRLALVKKIENRAATCIQSAHRRWKAQRVFAERLCAKRQAIVDASEDFMKSADPADVVRELFWIHRAICHTTESKEAVLRHQEANHAALVIQSAYRQRKAKIEDRQKREENKREEAARVIQQLWRYHYRTIMSQRAEKETQAARRIQCHVRGWLVRRVFPHWQRALEEERRRCFKEEDLRDGAATVLQSFWRRVKAERYAHDLRRDKGVLQQVVNEAAGIIQSAYRQYYARRTNAKIASAPSTEKTGLDHGIAHPPPTPPRRQRI